MSLVEMMAMPVAERAAKHALLAMWVVGSHLRDAFTLAEAWGFPRQVTDLFWWCKQKLIHADHIDLLTGDIPPPRMSMGYHSRKQMEVCLLFARGRGLPVLAHNVRQMIIAPSLGHSRKPEAQYERLAALYGTEIQRLELFARNTQHGWQSWGNEVSKFDPASSSEAIGETDPASSSEAIGETDPASSSEAIGSQGSAA
jgi:N6-adenosine-specific RNA methylase IME4